MPLQDTDLLLVNRELTPGVQSSFKAPFSEIIAALPPGTVVGPTAPTAPDTGQLWYNTTTVVLSVWDGAVWQPSMPAASETNAGVTETATQAEVDAGTDDFRYVTPLKLATTTLFDGKYVDLAGDLMTGTLSVDEQTIGAAWDLSLGNFWTADAIDIPQPINGVLGTSGLLRLTDAPISWPLGGTLKYAGGTPPTPSTFPAVIPFYVEGPGSVLLGTAVDGIV